MFKNCVNDFSIFYAMFKNCVNANGIHKLMDGDLVFKEPNDIEEHILSFYKTLYDSSYTNNVINAHISTVCF